MDPSWSSRRGARAAAWPVAWPCGPSWRTVCVGVGGHHTRPDSAVRAWSVEARCTPSSVIPVLHSSERTFPKRAILCVPFLANGWEPREAQHSCALLALRRVHSYPQLSLAPSRSREKVRTSFDEEQLGGRRRRRGQSHNMEVSLLRAVGRAAKMACRSPRALPGVTSARAWWSTRVKSTAKAVTRRPTTVRTVSCAALRTWMGARAMSVPVRACPWLFVFQVTTMPRTRGEGKRISRRGAARRE